MARGTPRWNHDSPGNTQWIGIRTTVPETQASTRPRRSNKWATNTPWPWSKKETTEYLQCKLETWNSPTGMEESNATSHSQTRKPKNSPSSYRPISLTSCLCKLLERILNSRLMWFMEKERKFKDEQAGFRPCRSTEDQVTYLTQLIEEGFQAKKQTVVVWVDLEKAFDRVWTKGLLLKLLKTNITHKMYNWIKQYIPNRKAKVCLKGKYSRTASFKQGVPQGGVLSPSLFLIFLNDLISTTSPNVRAVQYADDLALIFFRRFSNSCPKKTTNNPGQTRPVDNRLVYESKCHKNNLHGL